MASFDLGKNFTINCVRPTKIKILPNNFFGDTFKPNMSFSGKQGFAMAISRLPEIAEIYPEQFNPKISRANKDKDTKKYFNAKNKKSHNISIANARTRIGPKDVNMTTPEEWNPSQIEIDEQMEELLQDPDPKDRPMEGNF